MYKITANNTYTFNIEIKNKQTLLNGLPVSIDMYPTNSSTFNILHNHQSYQAEVISYDRANKTFSIKINSHTYHLSVQDRFDELLHQLGMDTMTSSKVSEIKAPMPGLVLKVMVNEGEQLKKGDNLLTLEAMKMENIIKSPADVTVKSIKIKSGETVEKNQVMIVFE